MDNENVGNQSSPAVTPAQRTPPSLSTAVGPDAVVRRYGFIVLAELALNMYAIPSLTGDGLAIFGGIIPAMLATGLGLVKLLTFFTARKANPLVAWLGLVGTLLNGILVFAVAPNISAYMYYSSSSKVGMTITYIGALYAVAFFIVFLRSQSSRRA